MHYYLGCHFTCIQMELLYSLTLMNILKLFFKITSTVEFLCAGCTNFELVNFSV